MRNSSVEVFRIIATFLVLIVHFNGWFVGGMPEKFAGFSAFNLGQDVIEAISCTCVNCFLVITGWYGLRFKWKHVWTIWSILVWIYVPCYIVESYLSHNFSLLGLIFKFIAIGQESYYVQCYLMLLFLSPILNAFIQKYGRKILPYALSFWAIEFILDWVLHNQCLGFAYGYQLTHFVLMYILGQTAYLYRDDIYERLDTMRCIMIYFIGTIIIAGTYIVLSPDKAFAYTNPVNIVMSFSLFFIFERMTFHNSLVNWIGSSTLAVYIMHCTPPIINVLQDWDMTMLHSVDYPVYLMTMALTIIGVFIVGILYDKVRTLFMPKLGEKICNWLSAKTAKYALPK